LSHDFRQAGPPGNVRIGPLGSSSVHGAVLVFAHWLHEQVLAQHKAAGKTAKDAVEPAAVATAWQRAVGEMSAAEQDPALWNWVRQELDAEYSRLLPLPEPNAATVARMIDAEQDRHWVPPDLPAAILHVLEQAGARGLRGWPAVLKQVGAFGYQNYDSVREAGAGLLKAKAVAWDDNLLILTAAGREHLRARKQPR
jgi:hypothetical protein